MTWQDADPPAHVPLTPRAVLRILRRAVPMGTLVFGGLAVLLALRPLEAVFHGPRRPWTPHITRGVCRGALWFMGLPRITQGTPMPQGGALVANHISWLDIFVLNAGGCVVFVSKAEVAKWPGIGWLARATGTVFVTRDRKAAARDVALLTARLALGQTLVFFPEGTSSDGAQVLPFKPVLFAPLIAKGMHVQPVTLSYKAPDGADRRAYGWWGDMDFAPHLLATLALPSQGQVRVTYHPPRDLAAGMDRKALAQDLTDQVRSAL
jgi:1-acyl-sn-glycerol-3-phosphate acyltransferase